jgi:ketosteroid isomerase-like protein
VPSVAVNVVGRARIFPEGRAVATGQPYGNRYISVIVIKDRKVTEWRDYLDPLRVFAALEGRPFEPDGFAATDS